MRYFLRRTFDGLVAALPRPLVRGFLKTFLANPDVAERAGFQVYPRVFYNPFPDPAEVDVEALKKARPLPGVPIDETKAVGLLNELAAFKNELGRFPRETGGSIAWHHTYPSYDTVTLYSMLRRLKPKRYIEVGCGWSTRASTAALEKNREEGAPYFLELELPGEYLKQKIQHVPLERFQKLEAGDVLFIDTSHILKVQNDVEYELTRILPALKRGVYVHIHDIFTPFDYPAEWLVGKGPNRGANNEQYALEILISGGRDWEVVLPVHLLWRKHRAELEKLLPSAPDRPAAFWIYKRESGERS